MDSEGDYQRWLHEWLGWDQTDPDRAGRPARDDRARQRLSRGLQVPRSADDEVAVVVLK